MTKGKKILAAVIAVSIAAGGSTGGVLFYRSRQVNKNQVEVIPVSNMMEYYWGDEISMDGMVVSGDIQSVVLSSDQMIEKVLVKEGDVVTKGTPLIKYDMTAVALDIAQKKTALAVAKDNVRTAKKELERLKGLRPSEEAPAISYPPQWEYPDEPLEEIPVGVQAEIHALTQAAEGDGSAETPYQFACDGKTVVRAAILDQLRDSQKNAVFVVYDAENMPLYAWLVRGDMLVGTNTADWTLGEQVTITEDGGVQIRGGGTWYGTIQVGGTFTYDPLAKPVTPAQPVTPTEPDVTEPATEPEATEPPVTEPATEPLTEPEMTEVVPAACFQTGSVQRMVAIVPLASTDLDNYMYSRAELKQKIAEQEINIRSMEIEQKRLEIEYNGALEKQENEQELAKVDGVVTKLAESVESLEQNEAFLVVQGSGGVMVEGTISEMNREKLAIGSLVNVTSWDTGAMTTAEVVKIGDVPAGGESYAWGENPNNSMYTFQAEITEDAELTVGNYVGLTFSGEEASDHFYIPVSYVRQENGQYYVMKAGKDDKLEKQVIQTGKIIYGGYSIEVISGLSEEDRICFPYGKYVAEGAPVKESDGGGMMY